MRLLSFVLLLLQVVTQSPAYGAYMRGWEEPCRGGSCTSQPRSSDCFDQYGEYVDGPIRATGHFYEGGSSTAAHPDPTSGYGPGVSEDHLDGFPGSHTSMGFGTDITQYNGDVDPDDAAELVVQLSTLGEFRAGLSKKRPPDYTWVAYVVFLHLWFVFWNNYMR